MGSSISQVQTSQGNQPVNPPSTQANYSPAQQQMGGKFGPVAQMAKDVTDRAAPQYPVGAPMPRQDGLDQNAINANPQGYQQFQQDASQQGYNYGPAQGKGGRRIMYSPTSNQPTMGQPNPYPNTVGQWDNASIQPRSYGKGKGG